MKVNNMYYDKLVEYYTTRDYPQQDLNIFGVRNMGGLKLDIFNDVIGTFNRLTREVKIYQGTTDPGARSIKKGGMPGTGAPFLVYGFHPEIWVVALHRGKYEALCSLNSKGCRPQSYIRDKDRNFSLADQKEKVQYGYIGINLHRAALNPVENIGPYSEGCQVVKYAPDYYDLIADVRIYLKNDLINYCIMDYTDMYELYNELIKWSGEE